MIESGEIKFQYKVLNRLKISFRVVIYSQAAMRVELGQILNKINKDQLELGSDYRAIL